MSLSDVVAVVVSLAMWAIVVWILYGMGEDYWSLGRKEKTAIEQTRLENMRSPWLAVLLPVGELCEWRVQECGVQVFPRNGSGTEQYACDQCVEDTSVEGAVLFNASCVDSMAVFCDHMDRIYLSFGVFLIGKANPLDELSLCFSETQRTVSLDILSVPDTALHALQNGTASREDLGATLRVGWAHQADLLFRLSQEQATNGSLKNDTSFTLTQFSLPRTSPRLTHVSIFPSSFVVQRVVYTQGETIWTLLGVMFGWIGVFSGVCVQGLIMSGLVAYQKFKEAREADSYIYPQESEVDTELVPKRCAEPCRCKALEEEVRELRDLVSQLTTLETSVYKPGRDSATPPLT